MPLLRSRQQQHQISRDRQATGRQQAANNTDRQTVCEKEGREVVGDARNWKDLMVGVQAPMALGAGAPVE